MEKRIVVSFTEPIRRLGIFLPRWIGDVVMATPTLRAVREHFGPELHVTGILKPYVRDVLAHTPWLDDVVLHDPRSPRPERRGWRLVKRLRRWRFDAMLVLTNSPRTAALARLSGARLRVGYRRLGHRWLLTHTARFPTLDGRRVAHSAVDSYARLAEVLGCPVRNRQVELATGPEHQRLAQVTWERLGLTAELPTITLNTGGAYGAAKRWPDRHFAELARRLTSQLQAQVLVVCGPAETESARQIAQLAAPARVATLADQPLGIPLTMACLHRSALLITTDSGPRHLAAALRTPTITLFGPTDPRWSGNYSPASLELQHPVPCGPCAKRVCPLGHHACMEELTPDRVFDAVTRWWPSVLDRRAA